MTLRIGIIGASGHGGCVLHGLRELPDARLCAMAPGSPDEEIAEWVASPEVAQFHPKTYPDYREMLDREKLDIVGINPFFYLNRQVCADALQRGVAPFCEKPLALELTALADLRRIQLKSGLPVGMMLSFRYEPMFHTARKLVQAGAIGEAVVGYSQKTYKFGQRPPLYRRRATFGGIIPWVGIHAIDWFQWISGRRYTAVTARQKNMGAPDYPEMEDHAACLLELDNGGSAVMTFDFLRPAGAPSHGDDRLRLVGTRGALEIRPGVLELIAANGPRAVTPEPPAHGLFADFALSVMDRAHQCRISTADAFAISEIALKTREAADRGVRVEL